MDPEVKRLNREQKARLKKVKAEQAKQLENDPLVEVVVRNHDFVNQGVPIEFTFMGKRFKIGDGEKVKLPACVVDHLNSLKVPDPIYVTDEATGQVRLEASRTRNRFTAIQTGPISRMNKGAANGKEAGR